MITAHSRAQAARIGALFHDSERIVEAFTRLCPNLALRSVVVRALNSLAHAARIRALLVHETRVFVALAVGRPSGAIALDILARRFASLARDWAISDHEFRVLVALASSTPTRALLLEIFALWCAETTTCRTDSEHSIRVGFALAILRPLRA